MNTRPNLDHLTIAKPCPASWEGMAGDDRVRHCELCKLNVYNFAALTSAEATALVEKTEGRLCGRLYRRKDGTILTADCPVGVRAAWRRVLLGASTVLAAVLLVSTVWSAGSSRGSSGGPSAFDEAKATAKEFLVKHLPDWMVPESWKPDPIVVMIGVVMAPDSFMPVPAPRIISK